MITFTKRDTLDSFEWFIENFEFRYELYNFYTLIGIFMKSLEQDIKNGYKTEEQEQVRKVIKSTICRHFGRIDFNILYTRAEIEKIVFKKGE